MITLTVALTSDALAHSRPSDWELRFNPRMPRSPRLWVGGVYLYPPHSSFPIQNYSLYIFLSTFSFQKNIFLLLLYSSENISRWM